MAYRMIFMGSDPIALPALNAIWEGECGDIELLAIYTQPDRPRGRGKKVAPNEIKTWALERGLPVHQPEKMRKEQRLEIEAMQLDSILVMAFGHLLSQKLIETPRYGIWNLHTSLLPKYRGASPIQCAVASGDAETGVSLMEMVREMDAGPVLDVEKVSIEAEDTALDVEAKLSAACVPLLRRGLPLIHRGEATSLPQDESQVSFVRKLGKEDGELDFRVEGRELAKRINGLFPWPGARARLGDLVIKIGLATWDEADCSGQPGEVLDLESRGLKVACGTGSVFLKRLQRPGGKMLDAADFMRGFELPEKSVFESKQMPPLVTRDGR
ncbi:methionyl-tRNA formyltransferase [Pelagicoccus sp. SDUM812003]|uniref:methionyl-tRNA formyltransferase n=1 Tax=Pelagicoccus sp. SDUM812003 TaxID=3041267 RepID=UPI00280DA8D4|nr:methionyl-tRNA formyltransferase [Pelagicoccus sp. SDUM812003]MDQ8202874.1 methionyl-tRNA formyltransferase [Pelagicoccus sp. SDUM812003]